MTGGALFWILVFAAAALMFFGIALVVSFRGLRDLRELLSTSERRRDGAESFPENPPPPKGT